MIYAFLALLMGGGLVLLGIGGDASGGLLDAFGLGDAAAAPTPTPPSRARSTRPTRRWPPTPRTRRRCCCSPAATTSPATARSRSTSRASELTESDRRVRGGRSTPGSSTWRRSRRSPTTASRRLMVQALRQPGRGPTRARRRCRTSSTAAVEAAQIVADARPSLGTFTHARDLRLPRRRHQARRAGAQGALAEAPDSTTQAAGHPAARSGRGAGQGDRQEHRAERARPRSSSRTRSAGLGGTPSPGGDRPRRLEPASLPSRTRAISSAGRAGDS